MSAHFISKSMLIRYIHRGLHVITPQLNCNCALDKPYMYMYTYLHTYVHKLGIWYEGQLIRHKPNLGQTPDNDLVAGLLHQPFEFSD